MQESVADGTKLRELYEAARGARGAMALDHPARRASEDLSKLLAHLRADGWSYSGLDRAMGATIGTTRSRLAKHGYIKASPSLERVRYRKVVVPRYSRPRIDITGQRFYKLVAVEPTGETGPAGPLWLFSCDCGNTRVTSVAQVRAGRVKACSTCPRQRTTSP
jgi:hypothetical protein